MATISDLRAEYERQLSDSHWQVLDRVATQKMPDGTDTSLELLYAKHILEFRDGDRWCDIHPLLEQPLARWVRLRKS